MHPRYGHRERFEAHLTEHRAEFERREVLRPEVYLAVRLGGPQASGGMEWADRRAAAIWGSRLERLGLEEAREVTACTS